MPIFELTTDSDTYPLLHFSNNDDWEIIYKFNGKPLSPNWLLITVQIIENGGVESGGDFFGLTTGYPPVFTNKALNILSPLVLESIEALPLNCVDCEISDLFVINVLEIVDCLDHSRSKITYLPSGRVLSIDSYVFREGCLEDKHIFKLPELFNRVYVSENFKALVESSALKGLIFRQVN